MKELEKYQISVNLVVVPKVIEEIIEMAGYAIGYWACEAVVDSVRKTYEITEDETNKKYCLFYKDIAKGIMLYIKNGNYPHNIIGENGMIETDEIDDTVADMIIQYACFDEVVYG